MESYSRQDLESLEFMDERELLTLVGSLPVPDRPFERCAIINARCGRCSEDCRFCGQSALSTAPPSGWTLVPLAEVNAAAQAAKSWGVEYFGIVISGRGPTEKDLPRLVEMIQALASKSDRPHPCLSPGICTKESLRQFAQAGLTRLHHNLETSENFFPNVCSTHSWRERYETLLNARELGLDICAGGLFGIGESFRDRVDLALSLAGLSPVSVPVNFYTPVQGSRLTGLAPVTRLDILRTLALLRLALPKSLIRLCAGRSLLAEALSLVLTEFGIKGLMTGDYLLTRGTSYESDVTMLTQLRLV